MPRMIDLVRKSQLSSNMMHAAARGALAVPPAEMMEILVHLALHNKVFGEQARMTLAGWDEKAAKGVAADPASHKEVLEYLISPKNLRAALLPALLENPAITEDELADLAATGSRAAVEAMLVSKRVKASSALMAALRSNPRVRANELAELDGQAETEPAIATASTTPTAPTAESDLVPANEHRSPQNAAPAAPVESAAPVADASPEAADEQILAQAIEHYLAENEALLAAEGNKPFQPIGNIQDSEESEPAAEGAAAPATESAVAAPSAPARPAVATAKVKKPVPHTEEKRRDSTLQKIAKLDIKGRIALAVRGSKEERSILIRDGTKLVALAVLESPKVSDGEVENFAQQKNVLEAVLRAIPLKRRFAKNYNVTRNLVYNPRTPLDLSLGLMKNLLVHDLKNLSGNKEVSDTIRKLALRMFKQKAEKKQE